MSVLQLASRKQVYLLDMLALGATPPQDFDRIVAPLMRSPTPLKLGYAVKGDFQKMVRVGRGERRAFPRAGVGCLLTSKRICGVWPASL